MDNQLMLVNQNEIELTKDGIKFIKKMQKAKIELAKMEDRLKDMFMIAMKESNVDNYVSPDGTFKVKYIKESTSKRFDSTSFKKDNPELYEKYIKESKRKEYIRFN